MKSLFQRLLIGASLLTLLSLSGTSPESQAAFDPALPEPLINSGNLPPEEADGPYQHWNNRQKYFLVIAVNDTGVPNTELPFTIVDAQEIAQTLTAQG